MLTGALTSELTAKVRKVESIQSLSAAVHTSMRSCYRIGRGQGIWEDLWLLQPAPHFSWPDATLFIARCNTFYSHRGSTFDNLHSLNSKAAAGLRALRNMPKSDGKEIPTFGLSEEMGRLTNSIPSSQPSFSPASASTSDSLTPKHQIIMQSLNLLSF